MIKPSIIEILEEKGFQVYHTGSREIMDNPPDTSDDDWLVLAGSEIIHILEENGFSPMGGESTSGGPNTVPWYDADHKINIILCFASENFQKWIAATKEAKRLKLANRVDRVALFKRYRVDDND